MNFQVKLSRVREEMASQYATLNEYMVRVMNSEKIVGKMKLTGLGPLRGLKWSKQYVDRPESENERI